MTPSTEPSRGLQLSSQIKGILFDIMGLNAVPRPHSKNQISWIHNPHYRFLTLPRHGSVNGIDQLFGNNTWSKGSFASDGFAALAKYDSNQDGVIDSQDAVFEKLRLWSDANFDGIAQSSELQSLEENNIASIDLAYDANFFEKDSYGNISRYKSSVKLKDGTLKLIFDLWFKFEI
jgi:hypothetical protein